MGITDNNKNIVQYTRSMRRNYRLHPAISAALLWCAPLITAGAAEWSVTPMLMLRETYSDNITLAPRGSEKDEFVTEIDPGISLSGTGRRLKLNLDYRMQNLLYLKESGRNRINHQLQANANAELVNDSLFLDAGAGIRQQLLSPSAGVPLDNISIGDRANVYDYRLSPYYRHNLGGYVDTLLRYTYSAVRYSRGASDSDGNRIDASFASGRKFTRLTWKLGYYRDRLTRRTADDVKYEASTGELRYRVSRTVSVLARGGTEHNDFETTATRGYRNGTYWAAGIGWHPGRRLRLDALYGDRYKSVSGSWQPTTRTSLQLGWTDRTVGLNPGRAWNGSFSLRTRRTTWQASYLEDTITTQQLVFLGEYYDPFSNEYFVVPPPGHPPLVWYPRGFFGLTDEIFTRKRGQASLGIRTAKSTLLFSVYNEKRDFLVSDDDQRVYGGSASWNWRFAAHTSLLLNGGTYRTDYRSSDREDTLWYINTGLRRQFGRNVDGSLTYRHTARDSSESGAEYSENRIILTMNMHF